MREEQQKGNDGDAASESGPRDPLQSSAEDGERISATPAIAPTLERNPLGRLSEYIAAHPEEAKAAWDDIMGQHEASFNAWKASLTSEGRQQILEQYSELTLYREYAGEGSAEMLDRIWREQEIRELYTAGNRLYESCRDSRRAPKARKAWEEVVARVSDRQGRDEGAGPRSSEDGTPKERDGDEGAGTPNHPQ